jgi:hypothetical protein
MNWSNIPNDIIYQHILPLLPIDTKLSLKVKPRKIPDDIIENLQKELDKIKHKAFVSIYRSESIIIEFLQIKKNLDHLEKKIYVHSRFHAGDHYAEYIYQDYGDQVDNMWEYNIKTIWDYNIENRKWIQKNENI